MLTMWKIHLDQLKALLTWKDPEKGEEASRTGSCAQIHSKVFPAVGILSPQPHREILGLATIASFSLGITPNYPKSHINPWHHCSIYIMVVYSDWQRLFGSSFSSHFLQEALYLETLGIETGAFCMPAKSRAPSSGPSPGSQVCGVHLSRASL